MILVIYNNRGGNMVQTPFKNISEAKKKADLLHSKGYSNIKVSRVKESILYIPSN